jgi:AcrR family transcriptional regulator
LKTDRTPQIKVAQRRSGRPTSASVADLDRTLIRVARQFFVAKGYGATSITEIASAARAFKGTLYARFPTKADLFRAILDEQVRQTEVELRRVGPKPKTLQAMLRIFAECAADMFILLTRGYYCECMLLSGPVNAQDIRTWITKMLSWFMASRETW